MLRALVGEGGPNRHLVQASAISMCVLLNEWMSWDIGSLWASLVLGLALLVVAATLLDTAGSLIVGAVGIGLLCCGLAGLIGRRHPEWWPDR